MDSKMKSFYRKVLLIQLGRESDQRSTSRKAKRKIARHAVGSKAILVVDDEKSSLELADVILGGAGFKVLTASTVEESKEVLQSCSDVRLLITDLRMPDEDGFCLLEFMRDNLRFRHIPIIIMTCCSHPEMVTRAIELGAIDYLTKPFSEESLLERVNRVFERAKGIALLVTPPDLQQALLIRMLNAGGFQTVTAGNGAEATRILAETKIRLVVSELLFEDMTGLDLMLAAKETNPALPFLFLNDPTLRVTDDDIRSAGGAGVVNRPFNNVEILRKVKSACGR